VVLVGDEAGAAGPKPDPLTAAATEEMASRLAHKLKNPLAALTVCAERLRKGIAGGAAEERLAGLADQLVAMLEGLSRTVSDISSRPAETVLGREEVDLNDLLSEALADVGRRAWPEAAAIGFEPDESLPPARGNRGLLRQAMVVLIATAREGAPAGGEVRVSTRTDDSGRIEIRASLGDGPVDGQERTLVPGRRGGKGGESGPGLPVALRIIERHSGSVVLRRNGSGGCELVFTLPPAGTGGWRAAEAEASGSGGSGPARAAGS
jgi:signal transduction histidine kinase